MHYYIFDKKYFWSIDSGHDEITAALIHHFYSNYDAFMLLLTKSQGSKFEDCVDEIVDMTEQVYRALSENMAKQLPHMRVNTYMRHWLTHMIIDAFIHLITHEPDEQRALGNMTKIMNFLVKGWQIWCLSPMKNVPRFKKYFAVHFVRHILQS